MLSLCNWPSGALPLGFRLDRNVRPLVPERKDQSMWELFICIGVTWAGCGAALITPYPSEESCYRALRELRTGDSPVGESGAKRNTVAYCRPKQAEPASKR